MNEYEVVDEVLKLQNECINVINYYRYLGFEFLTGHLTFKLFLIYFARFL